MPETPPPVVPPLFTDAEPPHQTGVVPADTDVFDDPDPGPAPVSDRRRRIGEIRADLDNRRRRQVAYLTSVGDDTFRRRVEEYVWNSAGLAPGAEETDPRLPGRIAYMQYALADPLVVERAVTTLTLIIGDITLQLDTAREELGDRERTDAEWRLFNGRKRMLFLATTVRAALNPIAGELRDQRRRAEAQTPERIATAQLIEAHKAEYARLVKAARKARQAARQDNPDT